MPFTRRVRLIAEFLWRNYQIAMVTLLPFFFAACGGSGTDELASGGIGFRLEIQEGNDQKVAPGSSYSTPLKLKVVDSSESKAIPGVEVSFWNGGADEATILTTSATSDADGFVTTNVVAPFKGNAQVIVYAGVSGYDNTTVSFNLSTQIVPSPPGLTLADLDTNKTDFARQQSVAVTVLPTEEAVKWCLSELQSDRPFHGSDNCFGGEGPDNGWYTGTPPTTYTLTAGDGIKTAFLWVADSIDQVSSFPAQGVITLDTVLPGTPTVSVKDPFTSSTVFTNQASPDLGIALDTDATAWCVKEQDQSLPNFANPTHADPCWGAPRPNTVTFSAEGFRNTFVWTRDDAFNVSAAAGTYIIEFSTTIIPEPTLHVSDPVTARTDYARQQGVNLVIGAGPTAVKWCVSETQTTRPLSGTLPCTGGQGPDNGWHTFKPTSYNLTAGDGSKTVYVWITDANNNTNLGPIFQNIILDSTPPAVPTIALSDPNTSSSAFTNLATVNMAVSNDTDAIEWCTIERDALAPFPSPPFFSDGCWSTPQPTTATFGAEGDRRVYLFTKDIADNISLGAGIATMTYDTSPPVDPTLSLADPTTALTTHSRQVAVSLNIGNDSNITKWCVSEGQVTAPASGTVTCNGGQGADNGWHTTKPTTFNLTAGDGVKTVYLWVVNPANNVNVGPVTAAITLDETAPAIPTVSMSDPNTASTTDTNQNIVNLSITADTDAVAWCAIEQDAGAGAPTAPLFNDSCFVGTKPTLQTLGATGSRIVYVYTKDIAYNVSTAAATHTINYSTTPPADPTLSLADSVTASTTHAKQPVVALTIGNDAPAVKWCVSEIQSLRPLMGTSICNGGAGPSNGWETTKPPTYSVTAGDGTKTVYLWIADAANNTSAGTVSSAIILDETPPATPTVALADPNTGSTTDTNQGTVDLNITNDTDAVAWCVFEQDGASPDPPAPLFSDGCFGTPIPTSQVLGATGSRKVFVYTKDVAENVSTTAAIATINYTTTPPADPTLAMQDGTTSSTTHLRQQTSGITIGNDATAARWCVSETQSTAPALGTAPCAGGIGPESGWFTTEPTSHDVTSGDGTKQVYVWVADAANNVNVGPISYSIDLDTTLPAVPTVQLADPNTSSTSNTNQSTVNLNITADTDAVEWCVFEQDLGAAPPTAPTFSHGCWVTPRPTSVNLGAQGDRRVYVYTKDIAENISAASGISSINYSTTPPIDPTILLADPTTTSNTYARQQAIDLIISNDLQAAKWCVSEAQNTAPALGTDTCNGGTGPSSGWFTTRPTSFNLTAGDGLKTVYIWIADAANNVNVGPVNNTITLDETLPATPTVSMADPNTASTSDTNQATVNLSITGDTDAVEWCTIEQSTGAGAPSAPLYNNSCFGTPKPTTQVLGATGNRRVYVYTKDVADNVSAAAATADINYSTTPPANPTLALDDNQTGNTTHARQTTVDLTIGNDGAAVRWCVSETQSVKPLLGTSICNGGQGASSGWHTTSPATYTLSAGDGAKTVYLWIADGANNVSAGTVSAAITLDETPPAIPTVAMSDPNTSSTTDTNQATVNLSIIADTDAVDWCPLERDAGAGAPAAPAFNDGCWLGVKPTTQLLGATGNRRVYLYTKDVADNVSTAAATADITYSTTAPANPTLALSDPNTSSATHARQQLINVNIGNDAAAVRWCVSETQSSKPALGTSACAGGTGPSSGWFSVEPTDTVLTPGDFTKTVYVWIADAANNVSAGTVNGNIALDTNPPAIPTVTLSDPNTGSTTSTNQTTVNLNITSDTDAVEWCVLEQDLVSPPPPAPLYSDGCFGTPRPTTQLLGAAGDRRVYVYTKDVAENVSTAAAMANINFDAVAPGDPILALQDPNTTSTTHARQQLIDAVISNDLEAARWCISETQTTKPALGTDTCTGGVGGSNGWFTTRPTTFSLSTGDGSKTVFLWVADSANNVNTGPVSLAITLDETVPATPTVTMSDPNTSSTTNTNQSVVSLGITGDTDAVAWCPLEQDAGAGAPSAPLFGDSCWLTVKPSTQTLGATGSRRVYLYTKDIAANVSAAAAIANISYSTTAPPDPTVTLADGTTTSNTHARQVAVNITIGNDGTATRWCVSEIQSAKPLSGTATCNGGAGGSSGWFTSEPTTTNLSAGDGPKTVYVWVADAFNNVNASASSAVITLDTTLPAVPTVAMSDPNTSSTTETNVTPVNLSITADTGAVEWCTIEQASAAGAPPAPLYNDGCFGTPKPTTRALGATGNRRVYVYTKDIAENVSAAAATADISYTTTAPPDPTLSLADGTTTLTTFARQVAVDAVVGNDATATRWCLSETQSTKPALGTSTCNGGTGPSSGWFTTRPSTFNLSAGDAAKTVFIWVSNGANNVNTGPVSANITLDTALPATPTVVMSDPNTTSTTITNQFTVNMAITGDTDADEWCPKIVADGAPAPPTPVYNDSCWGTPRPTTQDLGVTGDRRVYVFTKDAAQNISNPAGQAVIEYQTSGVPDPALTLTDGTTSSTTYARQVGVSAAITGDTTAIRWCISETQPTKPSLGTDPCTGGAGPSSGWFTTEPTTFNLSGGDATKSVYVWVADAANNTNDNQVKVDITLDTALPPAPTVAMSDPNTTSTTDTNQATVNLSITADTDAVEWCTIEQASGASAPSAPLFSDGCFGTPQPTTENLGGTGSRRVYVYTKDIAENVSAAAATADINYSTTAPANPTLVLSDATTSSTTHIRQVAVQLAIGNDATATRWCVSETQNTKPALGTSTCNGGQGASSGWHTTEPTTFNVTAGDGSKTVYVWISDAANNVNATAVNTSIDLDTALPAIPTVAMDDPNTGSTTDTNQGTVDLVITSDTDALEWCALERDQAAAPPAAPLYNDGCFGTPRPTSQVLGATGTRKVYIYTKDVAENVSSAAGTASIAYTTTAPSDPILALNDPNTSSTTHARQQGIDIGITNDITATRWCVSETQNTKPALGTSTCNGGAGGSAGWHTTEPTTFSLSASDASKTVYVWVADAANNVNTGPVSTGITLDETLPATPTVAMSDPNTTSTTDTNQGTVDLSITVDTDAVAWCVLEQDAGAGAPPAPAYSDGCWGGTRPTSQVLGATGNRIVYVYTKDVAENVSSPAATATIAYNTTAPANPTLALSDGTTSSTTHVRQVGISAIIGNDATAAKWCLSETQATKPALGTSACNGGTGPSNGWFTTEPNTFNLGASDALKTVYVWIADAANNVNATAVSTNITLDTVLPAVPTVAMSDPNTSSTTDTNQATVNLSITNDTDAVEWCTIEQDAGAGAPPAPLYNDACFGTPIPTTETLGATGNRRVYVYTKDIAENVSSAAATADISYSTSLPPAATLALSDGTTSSTTHIRQAEAAIVVGNDATAAKWCVSEAQSSRPALGTSACTGGAGASNGWHTTEPTTFDTTAGDGAKTVYVWVADASNNVSSALGSDSITRDETLPATPTASMDDPNTGSTTDTNQGTVDLVITGDTDALEWCVLEQDLASSPPAAPLYSDGCFGTPLPTSVGLGATGDRKIYVYTKDVAENVSSPAASATISYSTTAPVDPVLALTDGTTSSTTYARQVGVNVAITNDTGVAKWCLSESQNTKPALGTSTCTGGTGPSNGWFTVEPTTTNLTASDALKTVYVWVADAANNVNTGPVSDTITLDRILPASPTVALSDPNTTSTSNTNQATVDLSITVDTDAVAWCVFEQDSGSAAPSDPLFNNACWVGVRPTSENLGATGNRRVYVYTKDVAENVSSPVSTADIAYSTTPPANPTLVLSDGTTSSTDYARQTSVNAAIGNDGTATKWCISETQATKPALGTDTCNGGAGASSGWFTTRPTTFTLSSGDASKQVYLWVADAANNVSAGTVSDSITLDTVLPAVPTVALSDPNTSSTTDTNQATANLSITNDTDAVEWCTIEQASAAGAPPAPLYNDGCFGTPRPTTEALGATGSRRVYVYTKDVADNVSTAAATADITYSTSSPADPTLTLADGTTTSTTHVRQQLMNVTIGNDASAVKWCVSESQTTKPALGTSACNGGAGPSNGWFTTEPTTYSTATATNETKTVRVWVADAANNVNDNAVTDTIILDTVLPATPTVAMDDPNSGSTTDTNQGTVDLVITGDTDAVEWCSIEQSNGAAPPAAPLYNDGCFGTPIPTSETLGATGLRKVYVYTKDVAENVSAAAATATINYSTIPPGNPTLALTDPNTSSATYARQVGVDVAIGNDGTATRWCVSESQNTQPALGTSTCTDGQGASSGWHTTKPTTFNLTAGDALKTVYVWIADAANNVSTGSVTDTITLDTSAPGAFTITGATGNLDTNADNLLGTTDKPTANWNASTGADNYRVEITDSLDVTVCSEQVTAFTNFNFSFCTLTDTSANAYKIFVTAMDDAQNETPATGNGFSFTYDPNAPAAFNISGASSTAGDAIVDVWFTGSGDVIATWANTTGEDGYDVTIQDTGTPICGGTVTKAADVTTHTFTSCSLTDGNTYEFKVEAFDNAFNRTTATNSLFSFVVDVSAPANPTLDLADGTTGSTTHIRQQLADAIVGNDSGVAKWCVSETQSTKPATGSATCNGGAGPSSGWFTVEPATYTMSNAVNETKTVYAWVADAAGNVNAGTTSDTIVLDTVLPGTFNVTGATGNLDTTADAFLGTTLTPTANWGASTDATQYRVQIKNGADTATVCTAQLTAAQSFTFSGCPLINSFQYRIESTALDVAENETGATNNTFLFTVDTDAPAAFTISGVSSTADDSIIDNFFTGTGDVTGTWADTTGEDFYDVAILSGGTPICTGGEATEAANATTRNFAGCGLVDGNTYGLRVIARDQAGNTTAATNSTFSFDVDQTPPADPTLALTDPNTSSSVYIRQQLTNINVGNDTGVAKWCVSESQSTKPATSSATCTGGAGPSAGWFTTEPTTYTMANGTNELKTVYVWVADVAGNVSANAVSTTITLDSLPPGGFTISGATGNLDTTADAFLGTTTTVTANWGASSDAVSYDVIIKDSAGSATVCPTETTASTSVTFNGCTLIDGTTYTIEVTSFDAAQNSTNASNNTFSFTVDVTPPAAFSITGISSSVGDALVNNYFTGTGTLIVNWNDTTGENTYEITIFDGATPICGGGTAIEAADSTSSSFAACTFVDNNTYGAKVEAKDAAGNVTAASNSTFSFTVDRLPPTDPTLDLSDNTTGITTHAKQVNLDMVIGNDVEADRWCISETQTTKPATGGDTCTDGEGPSSGWYVGSEPTAYVLDTTVNETKTVYVWVADVAGNVSTGTVTDTIVFDNVPPGAFNIDGLTGNQDTAENAILATTNLPQVNWAASTDATNYDVHIRDNAGSSTVCAVANTTNLDYFFGTCGLTDGSFYKAYVTAIDVAGNTVVAANEPFDFQVIVTPPTTPTSLALKSPVVSPDNVNNPTIVVGGVNSGNIVRIYTDSSCLGVNERGNATSTGTSVDVPVSPVLSADDTYVFYATAEDIHGNKSGCSAASVSYILDTQAPADPSGWTMASPSSGAVTNDITPVVSGVGLTAENGSSVFVFTDAICSAPNQVGSAVIGGGVFDVTDITFANDGSDDGAISFYGMITDQAGNSSNCTDLALNMTLDTVAPTVTGLTNDPTPAQTKAWTWGCSEAGCNFRNVVDTSATTNPSGGYGATTATNQNSGDGTFYLHVQAQDPAGNESAVVHVSAILDNTPPNTFLVDDKDFSKLDKHTFDWGSSVDVSGIDRYEYAIGTTPGGTDIVNFTDNGLNITVTHTGLSLTEAATYYGTVRVYDNPGNMREVQGDGFVASGINLAQSTIEVVGSPATVDSGLNVTLRVVTKNAGDIQQFEPGTVVVFSHTGGTSTGTISATSDLGTGVYEATFTGLVAGSATTIRATIDGDFITSPEPTLQVIPGAANPANSTMEIVETGTTSDDMVLGDTRLVRLNGIDVNGNARTSGGDTITFLKTAGNSLITMGNIVDVGDGTYTIEIKADTYDTAVDIGANVNGSAFTGTEVTLTPYPGAYKRAITLDIAPAVSEHQVQIDLTTSNFTYANERPEGEGLSFYNGFTELDYWIQNWDTSGTSTVWVQIPNTSMTSFDIYYGNGVLPAGTSKEDTFSYSTQKDLYIEAKDQSVGEFLQVASYTANNDITAQTILGPTTFNIGAQYGTNTFTDAIKGIVSAKGPVAGRIASANGFDAIVPMSAAAVSMGYSNSRNTERWTFHNPNSTTVDIDIDVYTSGGAFSSNCSYNSVAAGATIYQTCAIPNSGSGVVTATKPIVGFVVGTNNRDAISMSPASTEIMGANSTSGQIAGTVDGTNYTIHYSNGNAPVTGTINKGQKFTTLGGGGEGGPGTEIAYVVADQPIFGNSRADGDGAETMSYLPKETWSSEYVLPSATQYIVVGTLEEDTIRVYDPSSNVLETRVITRTASNVKVFDPTLTGDPDVADDPGDIVSNVTNNVQGLTPAYIYFGTTADNINFSTGYRVQGNRPMFMYFEWDTQDESNIFGIQSGRQYVETEPVSTVSTTENATGAAASFSPTALSNLTLWLDGRDNLNIYKNSTCSINVGIPGDNVGCWKDKSGNGNDATQITTDTPVYTAGGIQFTGEAQASAVGDYLNLPNVDGQTIIAVVESIAANPGDVHGLLGQPDAGGSTFTNLFMATGALGYTMSFDGNSTEQGQYALDGAALSGYGTNVGASAFPAAATLLYAEYQNAQSNWQCLGCFDESGGSKFNRGNYILREIIVYDRTLTSGERTDVEAYLTNKWGL